MVLAGVLVFPHPDAKNNANTSVAIDNLFIIILIVNKLLKGLNLSLNPKFVNGQSCRVRFEGFFTKPLLFSELEFCGF